MKHKTHKTSSFKNLSCTQDYYQQQHYSWLCLADEVEAFEVDLRWRSISNFQPGAPLRKSLSLSKRNNHGIILPIHDMLSLPSNNHLSVYKYTDISSLIYFMDESTSLTATEMLYMTTDIRLCVFIFLKSNRSFHSK